MDKYKNIWEPVYEQFATRYERLSSRVVEWWPSAHMEITVKLDDGTRYCYNWRTDRYRLVHDPLDTSEEMDELEWRSAFADNLYRKMNNLGYGNEWLSNATGISMVSISKYLNKKSTPSAYNIEKIARALRCSSSELTNIR